MKFNQSAQAVAEKLIWEYGEDGARQFVLKQIENSEKKDFWRKVDFYLRLDDDECEIFI